MRRSELKTKQLVTRTCLERHRCLSVLLTPKGTSNGVRAFHITTIRMFRSGNKNDFIIDTGQ
jgi:hypothetical protein